MTPAMTRKMQIVVLYFLLLLLDVVVTRRRDGVSDNNLQSRGRTKPRQKLLIIVIDG